MSQHRNPVRFKVPFWVLSHPLVFVNRTKFFDQLVSYRTEMGSLYLLSGDEKKNHIESK